MMSKHGITKQILSLPGLFGIACLPATESLPLLTAFNEETAAMVRRYPDAFAGLAALPMTSISLACTELQRATELGLRGAILPADAFVSAATVALLRPMFKVGSDWEVIFLFIQVRSPPNGT